MATTTVSLTITSGDLTSDSLSLSANHTMYGTAGTTGPTLTTGLRRKKGLNSITTLFDDDDYDLPAYIFIKNTDTTYTNKVAVTIEGDAESIVLANLYGGQFMYLPYIGDTDNSADPTANIRVTADSADTIVEYMAIYTADS